ncbi:hypothetical protein [Rhodanobacter sp. FW106-PBR-LB-2-11]|uniref:hypothetical protein n=1 Tax=Rhodanobacter sp. FW106-PBR-LB-2-11 TaxID=1524463 RepID=UPI0034E42D06
MITVPADSDRSGATLPDAHRWQLILRAIEARAVWARHVVDEATARARGHACVGTGAFHRAVALACCAGADHPDADCPALFSDADPMVRAFAEGQARTREDAHIEASLEDLCLPTPDALLAELLEQGSASVQNTLLTWEPALEVTWYTNAYGVDGALCGTPDRETMRAFLIDTARGVEYGPIPH